MTEEILVGRINKLSAVRRGVMRELAGDLGYSEREEMVARLRSIETEINDLYIELREVRSGTYRKPEPVAPVPRKIGNLNKLSRKEKIQNLIWKRVLENARKAGQ